MKNLFLTTLLAIITVTLICCNQQEELTLSPDITEVESSTLEGNNLHSEEDVMTFSLENYEGEETSGNTEVPAREYCVYEIVSLDANCSSISVNDLLCIDCPNSGRCPGNFLNASRWEFVGANETCSGTWKLHHSFSTCTPCVRGGKKGYQFID